MADREHSLALQCTDRGQHGWINLGSVTDGHPSGYGVNYGFTWTEIAGRRKDECVSADERGRLHVRCPRCRRHVQWRPERVAEILAAAKATGVSTLDISRI